MLIVEPEPEPIVEPEPWMEPFGCSELSSPVLAECDADTIPWDSTIVMDGYTNE